jgi:hypothetical protein
MMILKLLTISLLGSAVSGLALRADARLLPVAHAKRASFTHPGVFVSKPQLDFVKGQVQAGAEPWKSAWNAMLGHELASLSRKPSPQAVVSCGQSSSDDVGNGCHNEREDALAAYAMALAWYISGDRTYAQQAMSYLDAWSATLQTHQGDNANLQIGWAGTSWVRAAELIRHSGAGWSDAAVSRFENMLRTKFPPTAKQSDNRIANWDLGMPVNAPSLMPFSAWISSTSLRVLS